MVNTLEMWAYMQDTRELSVSSKFDKHTFAQGQPDEIEGLLDA